MPPTLSDPLWHSPAGRPSRSVRPPMEYRTRHVCARLPGPYNLLDVKLTQIPHSLLQRASTSSDAISLATIPFLPRVIPGMYTILCCGRKLEWIVCASEQNGNQGRWFSSCNNPPQGEHTEKCSHFSWGSPKSTPDRSPDLASQPVAVPSGSALADAVNQTCGQCGCKRTRVHRKCAHRRCREHCIQQGGCAVRGHGVAGRPISLQVMELTDTDTDEGRAPSFPDSSEQENSQTVPSNTLEPPLPPLSPHADLLSGAQSSAPLPRCVDKGKRPVRRPPDSKPGVRYASQIEPIFTQLQAEQQARQEQQRQTDAAQKESLRRAKNFVVAYAWHQVCYLLVPCIDANVIAGQHAAYFMRVSNGVHSSPLQTGFTLPHFKLSDEVVTELELPPFEGGPSRIMYFNLLERCWVKALRGHEITLRDNEHHIFLRHSTVTNCPRFDELSVISKPTNLCYNLPAEHASVHTAVQAAALDAMSRQLPVHNATSPPSSSDDDIEATLPMPVPQRHSRQPTHSKLSTSPTLCGSQNSSFACHKQQLSVLSLSDSSTDSPPSFSQSPTSSSRSNSGDDAIPVVRSWPGDFYAIEIHNGFIELDRRKKQPRQTVAKIFHYVFGVEFVPGTYYDHRARWDAAPQSARDMATSAGKTPAGLYSQFMKKNPAKHAEQKAVRKRHARALAAQDFVSGKIDHKHTDPSLVLP
ncbi:hypothetical protein L210DRAFT_932653 [Boletus edulis BED1]|uniref:Uncharacterized protein n=1 Tax=Boletus edulis BED1 TaxID=1328754 RepID=A0AAD4C7M8_BOLED|nr:hypothetical protein L210DRAFT_932653 [Boletus edulis BED1]